MDWVLLLLLFLHVGGAIVAFGPTFTFPILGPMAGHEPPHTNFALRFQEKVITRLVAPLAIFQGVTGVLLIWKTGINVFATYWLLLAIVLYVMALVLSLGFATANLAQAHRDYLGTATDATGRFPAAVRAAAAHRGARQARPPDRHGSDGADRRDRLPDGDEALLAEALRAADRATRQCACVDA